jgi:hypothetical protein
MRRGSCILQNDRPPQGEMQIIEVAVEPERRSAPPMESAPTEVTRGRGTAPLLS